MDHNYTPKTIVNDYSSPSLSDDEDEVGCEKHESFHALVIDFIKSYPHLYDKSHKDYKDKNIKDASFAEIATSLNVTAEKVEKAWSYLKKKFSEERKLIDRETRSGSKASLRQQWFLYPKMQFFQIFIQKRGTLGAPRPKKVSPLQKRRSMESDAESDDDGISSTKYLQKCVAPSRTAKKKKDAFGEHLQNHLSAMKQQMATVTDALLSKTEKKTDDEDEYLIKLIASKLQKASDEGKKNQKKFDASPGGS